MTGREWARAWWMNHRNDEDFHLVAALAEAWTAGNEDGYRAGAMVTGTALEAVQRAMGRPAVDRRARDRDVGE